jgi:hypothetical protein
MTNQIQMKERANVQKEAHERHVTGTAVPFFWAFALCGKVLGIREKWRVWHVGD